jgi:hypothetical protein
MRYDDIFFVAIISSIIALGTFLITEIIFQTL